MSTPLVTYEDTKATIGTLPLLEPRPNSTNLRALTINLTDKLTTIRSQQSADFGYAGLVDEPDVYALKCATPWEDWPDPGAHVQPSETTTDRDNAAILYNTNKKVFDSQQNVLRAINEALNNVVPKSYRRETEGNTIGVKVYKPTDNPRTILAELRRRYGKATPAKKAANQTRFDQAWNPADPIKVLFDCLEECFLFAKVSKLEYTIAQMIDKGFMAIQNTGLYKTAVLKWNRFPEEYQTWPELKSHFEEAYEVCLNTTGGTARSNRYVNNTETIDDDDSISSIQNSLCNIHLANNANYQALQDKRPSFPTRSASTQPTTSHHARRTHTVESHYQCSPTNSANIYCSTNHCNTNRSTLHCTPNTYLPSTLPTNPERLWKWSWIK